YKLTVAEFDRHLEALAAALLAVEQTFLSAGAPEEKMINHVAGATADRNVCTTEDRWLFTADDGGVSFMHIADRLEARGWRGQFFIATDYLDRPGFLSRGQLQELRRRGHVLGSHSCSHPRRISSCAPEEMLREWRDSRQVLQEV